MISVPGLVESLASLTDDDVVRRVLEGETALYEVLVRRYNHRLYRIGRAILPTKAEAEAAMQDAFVRAYGALARYEARASFSKWITSILLHECHARIRNSIRRRTTAVRTPNRCAACIMLRHLPENSRSEMCPQLRCFHSARPT